MDNTRIGYEVRRHRGKNMSYSMGVYLDKIAADSIKAAYIAAEISSADSVKCSFDVVQIKIYV